MIRSAMTVLISRLILNIHEVANSEDEATELSTLTASGTGYSSSTGAVFTTRIDFDYAHDVPQHRPITDHASITEEVAHMYAANSSRLPCGEQPLTTLHPK